MCSLNLIHRPLPSCFLLINTLSFNGGTWNLAQRFIAAPTGADARKAALLSAALYLVWPLVLFFPMWVAPVLLPSLASPSESYAHLVRMLLPHGLIGLVIAGVFAHTMAMTSSDANAISAVVVRDILPALRRDHSRPSDATQLRAGRICTFFFLAFSMVIAIFADKFGGVLGLLILWFAALIGPIAVPILFGMLLPFRRSGSAAALVGWSGGLLTFVLLKFVFLGRVVGLTEDTVTVVSVGGPVVTTLFLYLLIGFFTRTTKPASDKLLFDLNNEPVVASHIAQ
jgi:SSS family solute:Na+ symporter